VTPTPCTPILACPNDPDGVKVLEGKSDIPNRLGIDTRVYLGSAELAAMCALAGLIATVPEYMEQIKLVNAKAADVYRYMNFDQIPEFVEQAATVEM